MKKVILFICLLVLPASAWGADQAPSDFQTFRTSLSCASYFTNLLAKIGEKDGSERIDNSVLKVNQASNDGELWRQEQFWSDEILPDGVNRAVGLVRTDLEGRRENAYKMTGVIYGLLMANNGEKLGKLNKSQVNEVLREAANHQEDYDFAQLTDPKVLIERCSNLAAGYLEPLAIDSATKEQLKAKFSKQPTSLVRKAKPCFAEGNFNEGFEILFSRAEWLKRKILTNGIKRFFNRLSEEQLTQLSLANLTSLIQLDCEELTRKLVRAFLEKKKISDLTGLFEHPGAFDIPNTLCSIGRNQTFPKGVPDKIQGFLGAPARDIDWFFYALNCVVAQWPVVGSGDVDCDKVERQKVFNYLKMHKKLNLDSLRSITQKNLMSDYDGFVPTALVECAKSRDNDCVWDLLFRLKHSGTGDNQELNDALAKAEDILLAQSEDLDMWDRYNQILILLNREELDEAKKRNKEYRTCLARYRDRPARHAALFGIKDKPLTGEFLEMRINQAQEKATRLKEEVEQQAAKEAEEKAKADRLAVQAAEQVRRLEAQEVADDKAAAHAKKLKQAKEEAARLQVEAELQAVKEAEEKAKGERLAVQAAQAEEQAKQLAEQQEIAQDKRKKAKSTKNTSAASKRSHLEANKPAPTPKQKKESAPQLVTDRLEPAPDSTSNADPAERSFVAPIILATTSAASLIARAALSMSGRLQAARAHVRAMPTRAAKRRLRNLQIANGLLHTVHWGTLAAAIGLTGYQFTK